MLLVGVLSVLITSIAIWKVQGAIVTEPGDVVYYPGSTIELTCELAIAATWVVNDVIYLIGQLENGSLPGHNISGINLVISNPMNNSRYYCSDGRNNGGVYRVLIAGIPAVVPDVTIDDNTININGNNVTLTLSWGEPFNNLDPIVNYRVSCSGDVTCPPNFTTTDNTTRSYTITNLTPMTNYTFSVVATNSIGSGEAAVVMITTPSGLPPINSITVSGNMCFETSVNISWNSPSINNEVSYRGMVLSASSNVLFMFNTSDTFYNFTSFSESTNYTVRIASVNTLGNGIYNMNTFYIPGQDNFALVDVTINDPETRFNASLNQTVLIVTWEPLVNPFCEVLYYIITLSTADVPLDSTNVSSSSTLIARFPIINMNTEYNITVVAVNRAGNGLPTSIIFMSTDSEADDDPTDDDNNGPMIALPVGGGIAGVFGVVGITVAVLSVVWLQKRKKSSIQSEAKGAQNLQFNKPPETDSKTFTKEVKKTYNIRGLVEAAGDGRLEDVEEHLHNRVNVNEEWDGDTALNIAMRGRHSQVVQLLLSKAATYNIRGLIEAAGDGRLEDVEKHLHNRVNVNEEWDGDTALNIAMRGRHSQVVQLLLSKGASYNIRGLVEAAGDGRLEDVKEHLQNRVDVNEECDGDTALNIAMRSHHLQVVQFLLFEGATYNIRGLVEAAVDGRLEDIKEHLQNGVDVNGRDHGGNTALNRAMRGHHSQVVEFLLSKGATDAKQYAVVDKAAKKQKNEHQQAELKYVQPGELNIQKGPGIRFKPDHTVQYGQFNDNT